MWEKIGENVTLNFSKIKRKKQALINKIKQINVHIQSTLL